MTSNIDEVYLEGEDFIVRSLRQSDLTKRYLGWMNDPEITQHLETGENGSSMEELVSYFENQSESTYQTFAIIDKHNDKHIGNLSLNPISLKHNQIGLGGIIGDKEYWGSTGAFVESMRLLIEYGFTVLKFHKIHSGVSMFNIPCIIASKKVKFLEEGYRKDHMRYPDGSYADVMIFGQINPYIKNKKLNHLL